MNSAHRESVTNWAGTRLWTPKQIFYPEHEEEITKLFEKVSEEGGKIKVGGSGHSWSDILDIQQYFMSLDYMSDIRVDPDKKLVTAGGGAKLKNIIKALNEYGLAFENLGSISEQTAAGVIATGTHGSGIRLPSLSSQVESLRLVDGTGKRTSVSEDGDFELFYAGRVHLGYLGAVTQVTFRCVDAYNLEERLELLSFDDLLEKLDNYIDGNRHFKIWWLPHSTRLQAYSYNKTDDKPNTPMSKKILDDSGVLSAIYSGLIGFMQRHPESAPFIHEKIQNLVFKPHTRVDKSYKILNVAMPPVHDECEYAIPREKTVEALVALKKLVESADYKINLPFEVRFTPGDINYMSNSYGRSSCYIDALIADRENVGKFYDEFEEIMSGLDGRPHWGKLFSNYDKIGALYPKFSEFKDLKKELDPEGIFNNKMSRLIGLD